MADDKPVKDSIEAAQNSLLEALQSLSQATDHACSDERLAAIFAEQLIQSQDQLWQQYQCLGNISKFVDHETERKDADDKDS